MEPQAIGANSAESRPNFFPPVVLGSREIVTRMRSVSLGGEEDLPPHTSPTARRKLIQAIENRNCRSIYEDALEFPPLELSVYIAAILRESLPAYNIKILASCLLRLSFSFTTMNQCSKVSWKRLTETLSAGASLDQLATFLKEDTLSTLSKVDFEFLSTTWDKLAAAFRFWDLSLEDEVVDCAVEPWLAMHTAYASVTVALVFCAYMTAIHKPAECSLDGLVREPYVQQFMLRVIAKIAHTDTPFYLLKELDKCFETTKWRFLQNIPLTAVCFLETILSEAQMSCLDPHNPREDALLVLFVADCIVCKSRDCDIVLFGKIFKMLASLEQYDFAFEEDKVTLIEKLLATTWKTSVVTFTCDTEGVAAKYFEAVQTLLDVMEPVLHKSCGQDASKFSASRNNFFVKIITAFLRNYREFAESNLNEERDPSRDQVALTIKAEVIKFIFDVIYPQLDSQILKNTVWEAILNCFSTHKVMNDNEFEVEELDFDGREVLAFTKDGETFVVPRY